TMRRCPGWCAGRVRFLSPINRHDSGSPRGDKTGPLKELTKESQRTQRRQKTATDQHGSNTDQDKQTKTREKAKPSPLSSVFIRVDPWLPSAFSVVLLAADGEGPLDAGGVALLVLDGDRQRPSLQILDRRRQLQLAHPLRLLGEPVREVRPRLGAIEV